MSIQVGTFTKSTDAAPVDQQIIGVPFTPQFIILWTAGVTSTGSFADGVLFSYGASDGTNDGAIGFSCQDAAATSNTSVRHAPKVLTIVQYGESLLAECELKSFNSDGFTLTWTTNDSNAYQIHYLVGAGPNLDGVALIQFQSPDDTSSHSITSLSFSPECLILMSDYNNTSGATSSASARCSMGVCGPDLTQYAWSILSEDGQATIDSANNNYNTSHHAIQINSMSGIHGTVKQIAIDSLDANGFTYHCIASAAACQVYALCLSGGSYDVGRIAAPTTPQAATCGFTPEGILFPHTGASHTDYNAQADLKFVLGAASGVSEMAVAYCWDDDAVADSNNVSRADTDACLAWTTDGSTVYTEQYLDSFDADGFTVSRTGSAQSGMVWLAMAFGNTQDAWQTTSVPYVTVGAPQIGQGWC